MSATMTPFLYQTRTLCSLGRSRVSHPALRNVCAPGSRRRFQASLPVQRNYHTGPTIGRVPTTSHIPQQPSGQRFSVQRVDSSPEHKGVTGNFTINRVTTGTNPSTSIPEYVDGVPFESMEVQDWANEQAAKTPKEIENLTNIPREESQQLGTTITVAERHAFQRIFSDIFARSNRLPHFKPDGAIPPEEVGLQSHKTIQEKLEDLFPPVQAEEPNTKMSIEEKALAISRYPPSLRPAAAKALGLADETDFEEDFENKPDPLEALREPERRRVEALMRAAKTDFELWAILEKEVFSLVGKLRLQDTEEEPPIVTKIAKKKSGRKPKKKKIAQPEAVEIEEKPFNHEEQIRLLKEEEEHKYQLALLGPLYPSYLLLGLRLLDRGFAQPSPLTLSILPKIKSLGPISHVLGGSVAFYNELIRINWYQHDNFSKVLQLLSEIEESGLEHDGETLQVITEICNMQKKVQAGRRGYTLRNLWTLPEFAPAKFEHWRMKIQQAIGLKTVR
ncbi:hypothetical protein PVAG01_02923 [Phlyctema vagabunda]|uniref:Mtf2-like C-terminal domain-containing protein n=1 Tax=Phlyctema vagabunda TaxID=108571 RepID=A0ABR4PS02_9HELO